MSRPLTSLARQLAHRLLGSPEMAAELAMRRSMLTVPGAGPEQPQSAGSARQLGLRWSFLEWLPASVWPLFEILRDRELGGEEQVGTVLKQACMPYGRYSCESAYAQPCLSCMSSAPAVHISHAACHLQYML